DSPLAGALPPHHADPDTLATRFFFPAPATAGIYTLSLHDALPISRSRRRRRHHRAPGLDHALDQAGAIAIRHIRGLVRVPDDQRSEEHTSELQSRENLVCRRLLEKKK